ncbi:carcinine hydrolase/isopenicillin-N N-acyltransferase family protein [Nonomuraea sp. NPDC050643]|uniref:carcinine hydrolase/isopenicillin-N N-acyltransferase family protein n=1 Tax=Nonomuraea sp. NPDC050643 TaxID=3155660 RepID=UPI0034109C3F
MRSRTRRTRPAAVRRGVAAVMAALALCVVLPACAPERPGSAAPRTSEPASYPPPENPPESPSEALSAPDTGSGPLRQTPAQKARTAAGLRQVDDLPLYELTYHGGYDPEAPLTPEELAKSADGWACSLFHRPGEFGRNFDWDPNPAMIVHAAPPGGYASLSLSDVSYVMAAKGPPDLADPQDRRRLAHAVLAPFDGMNEKGLAVGLAAAPDARLPARTPGRVAVGGVRIIRLLLDRAATVPEAVALMRRHDVDFTGGPQLHYLLADRAGRSAVVEYGDGRLNVIDDRLLTNITMTGTDRAARLADRRYRTLAEGGDADALELLRRVAQPHTRWSVVYDLDAGTARLVTGQRWDRVHTIRLTREAPSG